MKYDPDIHRRRSIRMKSYDYSRPGAYFATICAKNNECLFGRVADGETALNDAGKMIQTVWEEIPRYYPGVETDEFVIMPNHIHGIIVIGGALPGLRPGRPQPLDETLSLPDVVHRFKTLTTKRYADGVRQKGWPPFLGKLWQRNYYEHIIRDEDELSQIRRYIIDNPLKWELDRENPMATSSRDAQLDTSWQV